MSPFEWQWGFMWRRRRLSPNVRGKPNSYFFMNANTLASVAKPSRETDIEIGSISSKSVSFSCNRSFSLTWRPSTRSRRCLARIYSSDGRCNSQLLLQWSAEAVASLWDWEYFRSAFWEPFPNLTLLRPSLLTSRQICGFWNQTQLSLSNNLTSRLFSCPAENFLFCCF